MPSRSDAESTLANKDSKFNALNQNIETGMQLPWLECELDVQVTALQRFPGFFGPGGFASSCNALSAAKG
jgi:hypothetical protein